MPEQETFFEQHDGTRHIRVVKSYDQAYARETFQSMDEQALQQLWIALKPEEIYDPTDLPGLGEPEGEAFLWDELLEQAREDGSRLSFFVVSETEAKKSRSLFVSPDWPSAEAFAKRALSFPMPR